MYYMGFDRVGGDADQASVGMWQQVYDTISEGGRDDDVDTMLNEYFKEIDEDEGDAGIEKYEER